MSSISLNQSLLKHNDALKQLSDGRDPLVQPLARKGLPVEVGTAS